MEPQQELFTYLRRVFIEEFGECVYDGYLPPEGTQYPFIFLGDTQQIDDYAYKSEILANSYQTITVWMDSPMRRGTLSAMLSEVKKLCRRATNTGTYSWAIRNIDQRISEDVTTGCIRGDLDVEFKLLGGN